MDPVLFQQILIRVANNRESADPKNFLERLVLGNFEAVEKNGTLREIAATTINGQTVTFSVPDGISKSNLMANAELALQTLERGVLPTRTTLADI